MATSELQIVIGAVDNTGKTLNGISKTLEGFGNNLEKIGKKMSDIGSNLTKKVTVPLLAVGGAALKVTSDMEQNKVAFEVLLGSGEKASALLKDLADFAAKTPFDLPGVVTASKQLLAYGYTQEQILPTMKMLGDVAAGVGAPVGDLAYLFGTLKAQGKAMTIDIRQFANRGIPIWENLAAVMGATVEETQKMVTEGKVGYPEVEMAFQRMTNEGGQFYNLMEKESETFGGTMSNIKDNITRVAMSFMGLSTDAETYGEIIKGGLFDTIKNAAEETLAKLDEFTTWFNNLSPEIKKMIVIVFGVITVLGPLLIIIGKISTGIGAIIKIIPVLGSMFTFLSGPVGIAIAVITALVAVGVLLWQNWDTIKAKCEEIWNKIKTAFQIEIEAIKITINNLIEKFKALPGDIWNGIKNIASTVGNAFKGAYDAASQWVGNLVNNVVNWFTGLPDKIWNAIKGIGNIIAGVFKNIHIPLPHFKFYTQKQKVGPLTIDMPKFDVNWYQRGGIFKKPSIIGVGEAGPEAVVPLNKAGMGNVNITVTGNTFMGIEDFADQIDKILMDKLRYNLRVI